MRHIIDKSAMGEDCPSGSRIGSAEADVHSHTGSNPVSSPTIDLAKKIIKEQVGLSLNEDSVTVNMEVQSFYRCINTALGIRSNVSAPEIVDLLIKEGFSQGEANHVRIALQPYLHYPMNDWKTIDSCPEEETVFFASYYTPSEHAYLNGSRAHWNYGTGSKIRSIYTGILGNPSHWAKINPPETGNQ